jgi:carboxymethylenebutenolidase
MTSSRTVREATAPNRPGCRRAMMRPMSTYRIDEVDVDSGRFDLHVWTPEAGTGPGMLLIQEIFGVGAYIRAVAERLADLGYVVGAPDVFWRIQRNWEADHSAEGLESSLAMMPKFDVPQGVGDCVAALHRIEELPEVSGGVGVIGFCLGGTLGYLTSAVGNPACCVSYYGTGIAGMLDQLDNIECPVLFHFGEADAYISTEQVDAIRAAVESREELTINTEPAGHAFDNHEAKMFWHEGASASAWAQTTAFLARHLPVA